MYTTEPVPLDQAATGLSVADAAELLGVTANTVRAHLRQGTLAGEKIGGSWVVYLAGLPVQSAPAVSTEPPSIPASDRPAPRSSRPVTILAWLLVLLQGIGRRLDGGRPRGRSS